MKWFALVWIGVALAAPAIAGDQDWELCAGKDADAGVAACERVIHAAPSSPNSANAYYNRGLWETRKGDHNAALAYYNKAIELVPEHDFALHNRAMIYDMRGQYEMAISDFTKAILANPIAGHFYNRGRAYQHTGQWRLAADDYTVALALWQSTPIVSYPLASRCYALAARGVLLEDARADCERAVEADPKNGDFLILRSLVKYREGDFAGAAADASGALAGPAPPERDGQPLIDVGPADGFYVLALAQRELGNAGAVNLYLDMATKSDKQIAERYAKMGLVLKGAH